jgi:hypothetical protein
MIKAHGKNVRLTTLGLATATVLTLAAPAFAGEAPAAAKPRSVTVNAPSPALLAGIQDLVKRGQAGKPAVQESQDGTLSMTLGGSFLNLLIAQAQPDGSFRTFCVTAPDAAKTLAISATAAPAFEDK